MMGPAVSVIALTNEKFSDVVIISDFLEKARMSKNKTVMSVQTASPK